MTRKKKKLGKPPPVFSKFDLVSANARSSSKASLSSRAITGTSAPASAIEVSEDKNDSPSPPTLVDGATDLKKSSPSGTVQSPDPKSLSSCVKNQDDTPAPVVVSTSISPQKIDVDSKTEAPTAGSPSKPARKWSSVVSNSSYLEELGSPSQHVSGAPFVLIPDENIEEAKEEFKEFIFARFHGDAPEMGRVIGVVNAIWARSGPRIFVHKIGEGTYLLRVINERTRAILLGRNMWNIAGFPMFVAPWSPDFNPEELPITSAVVPVEFRDVPYLLFNKQSLRRIATAIGKPVSLAPETERKENFEVAKINIRVDLTKTLPSEIVTGFTSGREVLVKVSYPWLPLKCGDCAKYGHATGNCGLRNPIPKPAVMYKKRQQSLGPHRGNAPRPGRSRSKNDKNGVNLPSGTLSQVLTEEVVETPVQQTTSQPLREGICEGGNQSLPKEFGEGEISDPIQHQVEDGQFQVTSADPTTADLISVATISILESIAASIEHPPTIITVNDTIENPMVESTQILPDIATTSTYDHSTLQKGSTSLVEPDLGSNKFASLISPNEEEEDPVYLDDELDSLDLTTPFGKRILRDRPVKLSLKAKEMNWQIVGRGSGRGNRGRGNRGGRG